MDLENLQQAVSNQFSPLPVYGGSNSETPLYNTSDGDINEDIGSRPNAPLFDRPARRDRS